MPSDKSIAAYFEPLTKTDLQRFKDHVEMATHKLTATELVDQIAEMRAKGYKVTQSATGWNVRAPEKRSFVTPGDIVSVRAQLMAYLDQMCRMARSSNTSACASTTIRVFRTR
ncbi:hypothetical protein [Rhizobium phage RHEph12]|nr:hypothetical protein [Rhizobium phage RHEph12]